MTAPKAAGRRSGRRRLAWSPRSPISTPTKSWKTRPPTSSPTASTPPRSTYRSSAKDGKTDHLLIGDDTLNGSGAYAKLAGDAEVFTVATTVKTSLDKSPDDLRDKRLLTFDSDKLTRVELTAKGPAVEFGKNGQNEWQIVKPRPLRADGSAVDGLVSKLKDAKMDLTDPDAAKTVRRSAPKWPPSPSPTPAARRPSKSARQRQERLRQEFRRRRHLQGRLRPRRRPRKRRGRFPQQEALRFRLQRSQPRSSSRARSTPRAATSGCPAARPWTTPPCRP